MIQYVIKQLLITAILIYVFLGAYLYVAQTTLTYHPSKEAFTDCVAFSSEEQVTHKNTRMYVSGTSSDYLVVYHGNAGRACNRAHFREYSNKTLVILEYPGYAGDTQKPSEERTYQAVNELIEWLTKQEPTSVTVLGESLGAAVAAYHSTQTRVDQLILINPFSSLEAVAKKHYKIYPVSWLIKEEYPTNKYLEETNTPTTIIHAEKDRVVPATLSEDLRGERTLIQQAGHNNIYSYSETRMLLQEILTHTH